MTPPSLMSNPTGYSPEGMAEEFLKIKAILQGGGVFAYPTETVYGLGGDPFQREAVQKIMALKGRSLHQTPLLLIPNRECLPHLTKNVSSLAQRLMDAFWPGPLTIVFEASREIPSWLLRDDETIALRQSSHPWIQTFLEYYQRPIISTSANPSKLGTGAHTIKEVKTYFPSEVGYYVDGGTLPPSRSSTIVSLRDSTIHLLRRGEISLDELKKFSHG